MRVDPNASPPQLSDVAAVYWRRIAAEKLFLENEVECRALVRAAKAIAAGDCAKARDLMLKLGLSGLQRNRVLFAGDPVGEQVVDLVMEHRYFADPAGRRRIEDRLPSGKRA